MRSRLFHWVSFGLMAFLGSLLSLSAFAQAADYPSKPEIV